MEENNDIDSHALDARDTVSRQTNEESTEVCNQCCFPIETGFVKQVWDKVHGVRAKTRNCDCAHCRHRQCHVCEEYSAAKQHSDYWICHRCKELNRRVANLYLKEVFHGLG